MGDVLDLRALELWARSHQTSLEEVETGAGRPVNVWNLFGAIKNGLKTVPNEAWIEFSLVIGSKTMSISGF